MKKTILIDARLYGLEHSGIGRYLIHLIEALKKEDRNNQYYILLTNKYFSELNLPDNWKKVRANYRHYTISEQLGLIIQLSKIKPDLVHFPSFNIPIFWWGKFLVTIHDMSMHYQKRNASKLPLLVYLFKRIPYKLAFWIAVKRSKKIIVPTKTVKKEIINYYNVISQKISVIYEGVDKELFTRKNEKTINKYNLNNDYFLYVGTLYPHKNLEKVLEAISYIKKVKGKNYQLVIASARGHFTNRLKEKAKELDIRSNIKFLGFVPNRHLPSLYRYSKALIYPSLSEGFGLQGLEAMLSGTLVLASDISVFKEIYQNNALYFDPNDKVSIANRMLGVIKMNKHVKEKRIKDSQKFIKKYTWEKMAEETLSIYKKLF